jgi:hypothetical protein
MLKERRSLLLTTSFVLLLLGNMLTVVVVPPGIKSTTIRCSYRITKDIFHQGLKAETEKGNN